MSDDSQSTAVNMGLHALSQQLVTGVLQNGRGIMPPPRTDVQHAAMPTNMPLFGRG
jgi:hypothetical protein